MINHSLRTCKCSFSYFLLLYSNRYSSYSVTSHVVLFAYSIKLNISTRKRVTKIRPKKLYCEFSRFLQCNEENMYLIKFRVAGSLTGYSNLRPITERKHFREVFYVCNVTFGCLKRNPFRCKTGRFCNCNCHDIIIRKHTNFVE